MGLEKFPFMGKVGISCETAQSRSQYNEEMCHKYASTVMSSNSVVKFLCFLRLLLGELVIGGVARK